MFRAIDQILRRVSIRSRRSGREERHKPSGPITVANVSIRPRRSGREERTLPGRLSTTVMFQSAPGAQAGRNVGNRHRRDVGRDVSIRPRRSGREELESFKPPWPVPGFQSAPGGSGQEELGVVEAYCANDGFNPPPAIRARVTRISSRT